MFNQKKTSLFSVPNKPAGSTTSSKNQFLFNSAKKSAETLSGNLSKKYSSSGSEWVDQFSKLGSYKTPRQYKDIVNDCETLWGLNKELCVKFIVYTRMISRRTNIPLLDITTEKPQSGAELKYEGVMRLLWLYNKDKEVFWNNIGLFIAAGSCKDIINMLRYDLMYHGWDNRTLDWSRFGNLIKTLLENPSTLNLVKKYLPQIKPKKKCTTVESQANNIIAKWISFQLFGDKTHESYRKYRQLKTSGTAHQWQQLISQRKFNKLDFKSIHGRALHLLVKSKFLKNQNLQDRYSEWISTQKTIKYTGFVHEILCQLDYTQDKLYEETTNKQFQELVNKMKDSENLTRLIVVRDTSGSMGSQADGTKFSCNSVAKALALYFSEFLTGEFANHWIEFNSQAKLHSWKGDNVVAKWRGDRAGYLGSTNFQSVIDLFCDMKRQGTPEEDFPQGILCISDNQLNPADLGETNVETAKKKLNLVGFSKEYQDNFKIIFWNLSNNYYGRSSNKSIFETFGNVKNVFYMSGYSASNVKFVLENKVETAEDLFNEAMSQELLDLVKV